MHAAAGLANGDLRRKGDGDAVAVAQLAHHPFGYHQLVGGILKVRRQKLYLVLLVHHVAVGEVAHLAVTVFDLAAGGGNQPHGLRPEVLKLAERLRHMVSMLVLRQIGILLRRYGVVLQLAHHLKLHATRGLAERAPRFLQRILRRQLEGLPVFRVERTQQVQRGHLGKGVYEGRPEARYDVEVRVAGLDIGKQAAPVHALAARQHLVGMSQTLYHKIQRVQLAVIRHIAEIDHLYLELLYNLEDISLGELALRLLQKRHQRIRIKLQLFLCHSYIIYCF